jgi:hypothetical protein
VKFAVAGLAACLAALLGGAAAAQAPCALASVPQGWNATNSAGVRVNDPVFSNPALGGVGAAIARARNGVTNIRGLHNDTSCPLTIRKRDGSGRESRSVGPNSSLETTSGSPGLTTHGPT